MFLPMNIISTAELFRQLEKRYTSLRYNIGMFKPLFAADKKIFFDCRKTEKADTCLTKALARQDFEDFSVLSVVEEEATTAQPAYSINESKFVRIGRERLEDFINRYDKNLKDPLILSMQLFGVKPLELIGFSYTSPEERAELLKQ